MVKIDGRETVLAVNFLVANDKEVEVALPVPGATYKLFITFVAAPAGEAPSATINGDSTHLRFVFKGWSNPLGSSTREPTRAGTLLVGTRPVYFEMINHGLEGINHAHFYLTA